METTIPGALLFGLYTSLHCVGMCGPLACGIGSLAKSESARLATASLYHASRLFSYASIGAVCGAIGQQPLKWFFASPAVLLPWVLVIVLLAMACGLEKIIPYPAAVKRFTARVRFKSGKFSACGAAATMGLLTPLLPCGHLYIMFAATLLAGSAVRGAEFALAFGLGTVPLLWLTQQQFHRIRAMLGPVGMGRLRQGLALVTALVLAWRLHGTIPPEFYGPKPAAATPTEELPSCCP